MNGLRDCLPTPEEFYKCHCGHPEYPVCYWPCHRDETNNKLFILSESKWKFE